MEDNFKRLKKTFYIHAAVKSAACGLSAAMVAVAVILLCLKLNAVYINPAYYVLVAVAVAAATGGLAFLFFRPNDKKIAKRLDCDYGLSERAKTMVAFENVTGEVVEMQRRDAQAKLAAVSSKDVKFKRFLPVAVAFVLSLALLFTGAFIPGKSVKADDNFTMDKWQVTALENLIKTVENSEMEITPKALTVGELKSLTVEIKDIEKESEMKTLVIGAIVAVDKITADANTYPEISEALIAAGEDMKPLGEAFKSLSSSAIRAVIESFASSDSSAAYSAGIVAAVALAGVSGDELSPALLSLSDGLLTGDSQIVSQSAAEIAAAVVKQGVNGDVCVTVIKRLMDIFKISASELPELENYGKKNGADEEDKPNGDKDEGVNGGVGDGNVNWGGDAEIYDPDEGRVKYGEVIDAYNARLLELQAMGIISEEDLKNILDYFDVLYGAKDKPEDKE